jgi:hypothetical protein
MAQATNYKRSISGSVGSGMKSVLGGSGRRFFILEHKVSSKYHKAGESQRIIVDQIEIGRDPRCQVRFDEGFTTVSRRHAAIVKDGDNWKLVQLSKTNSTYLNGHKVENEWYLQNGDEIQLSTNGPKLGFLAPAGDKGLVKSIGMTARLSLFRQQALRPYKTAVTILACCLLLGCGIGAYYMHELYLKNQEQANLIALNEKRHAEAMAVQDSLLTAATSEREKLTNELSTLKSQFGKVSKQQRNIAVATGNIDNAALTQCLPNVFFVYVTSIDVTLPNGESGTLDCSNSDAPSWCGTGFLLENGTFVTARHVIEAWSYWNNGNDVDEDLAQLNCIMNNGGKVRANFVAISSSGKRINLSSSQFSCNRSGDQVRTIEDGIKMSMGGSGNNDIAYASTNISGGLKFNKAASNQLERGTKLTILGFPLGLGANSATSIKPISSTATVGVDGLDRGVILTSETNFEHGCSGGPALVMDDSGNYCVIGIVSAIAGRNTGFIVPISALR